jgi:hypothetical protein
MTSPIGDRGVGLDPAGAKTGGGGAKTGAEAAKPGATSLIQGGAPP